MSFDWNERNIGHLKDMWAKGLTCSAIAERLGCTKNAVAGKAQREGLPLRGSPIEGSKPSPAERLPYDRKIHRRDNTPYVKSGASWSTRKREEARQVLLRAPTAKLAPPHQPKPKLVPRVPPINPIPIFSEPQAPYTGAPMPQEQIGAKQCRWICGNERGGKAALMCGAPTVDGLWCECHHKRVYTAPKSAEIAA